MAAGIHALQRRGLGGAGVVRQQIVGVAVHEVAGIALDHQPLGAGQAEFGHHSVQIGRIIIGIGREQELAACAQVAAQKAHLIHQSARRGKVLCRDVDDEQVAVLRDAAAGKQVQRREGEVLIFQCIG